MLSTAQGNLIRKFLRICFSALRVIELLYSIQLSPGAIGSIYMPLTFLLSVNISPLFGPDAESMRITLS